MVPFSVCGNSVAKPGFAGEIRSCDTACPRAVATHGSVAYVTSVGCGVPWANWAALWGCRWRKGDRTI